MPELYIIGGSNGSGKTTVALSLLPNFLEVFEYSVFQVTEVHHFLYTVTYLTRGNL